MLTKTRSDRYEISEYVKDQIRQYLLFHGISSRELAKHIGVANSTVSRWISVKGPVSMYKVHWDRLQAFMRAATCS